MGEDSIHIGASAEVVFEITTVADMSYAPMTIEFMLPFENDSAVISVCRAELIHIGKNLPCADRAELNETIAYVSK